MLELRPTCENCNKPLPPTAPDTDYEEIWANLVLDELRVPALSGIAANQSNGEVDLF